MKVNSKLLLSILFVLFVILGITLWFMDEINIALFTFLFAIFSLILFCRENKINKSPESIFKSEISNILKTYDAILIEVENIPDLKDKNIIKTQTFKDMVNIEFEFRKPVYYVHNEESYDFILINKEDTYIYTLKINEEKNSLLEAYLDNINQKNMNASDLDIIDSLDKTTVIRVDNNKEYLVSPVKKSENKM